MRKLFGIPPFQYQPEIRPFSGGLLKDPCKAPSHLRSTPLALGSCSWTKDGLGRGEREWPRSSLFFLPKPNLWSQMPQNAVSSISTNVNFQNFSLTGAAEGGLRSRHNFFCGPVNTSRTGMLMHPKCVTERHTCCLSLKGLKCACPPWNLKIYIRDFYLYIRKCIL